MQGRDAQDGVLRECYNYKTFTSRYYEAPLDGPHSGDPAPSFALQTTDGNTVRSEDFLGRKVFLEFASLSCPQYREHVPAMNRLTWQFPNVAHLVLYVREAHPGRHIPTHRTYADKLAAAKRLESEVREMRPVLVDDIEGTTHRSYGRLPNMGFLISEDGVVNYRSNWTDPNELAVLLSGLLLRHQREEDEEPAESPRFGTVLLDLWRAGPGAVWDYLKAVPSMLIYRRRPSHRKKESSKVGRSVTAE